MSDLPTDILAAAEERLRVARAACHGHDGRWHLDAQFDDDSRRIHDCNENVVVYDEGSPSDQQAEHIAANDPATIIRMCERDLKVLERHVPSAAFTERAVCRACRLPGYMMIQLWPCPEITDLATAYRIEVA